MNPKNMTTFPRLGNEFIKVLTKIFIPNIFIYIIKTLPLILFMLLKGLSILIVLIDVKF